MDTMEQRVASKYPKLFAFSSHLEFLCEGGWESLIEGLCHEIAGLLGDDEAEQFAVVQVKQKYGELRFYVRMLPEVKHRDLIFASIAAAKERSLTVCEKWRPTGTP